MEYRPVHFEIPCNDIARGKKFYEDLFGWKITKPEGMDMDYYFVMTAAEDSETPGINGGMMQREAPYEPEQPNHVTTNYITVKDVEEHAKKAEELGAKIAVPKTPVADMGSFVIILDPENNLVGLWEDTKKPDA